MTNGRVTNAEIYDKIESLQADISTYRIHQERRIVYLETCLPSVKKDIDRVQGDVDTLKKRDYIVGGIGGVLAAVAGILGVQK